MTFISKNGNILTCNNFYKHPPISFKYLDHGTEECPLCKLIDAEKSAEYWKEEFNTAQINVESMEDDILEKDKEILELRQTIRKLEDKD